MKYRFLVSLVLLIFWVNSNAKPVVISGSYEHFKNKEMLVTYKKEGFTKKEYVLDRTTASSKGEFSLSFNIEKTQVCYIELGKYTGVIFAEPGHSYQINFDILDSSKLNNPLVAFESGEKIVLGLKMQRTNDLQTQIALFEKQLELYQGQIMVNQNKSYAQDVVDASIKALNTQFGVAMSKNDFLNDYIHCNYAMLELLLDHKRPYVVDNYLDKITMKNTFNNPAYWDLMNAMWSDHLSGINQEDALVYGHAIQAEDLKALKYIFVNQVNTSDRSWVNWALLEILYNEKSGLKYPTTKILSCIEKAKQLTKDAEFRSCCDQLLMDMKLMSVGSSCPVKSLGALGGGTVDFGSYRGKILLLYFFNSAMSTTNRDLNELKMIKQKSRGQVEVVGVRCFDEAKVGMSKLEPYKYDIHFAKCSDKEIFYQFQIYDIPNIQIYDEKGLVVTAKAPTPGDGLVAYVNQLLHKINKRTEASLHTWTE